MAKWLCVSAEKLYITNSDDIIFKNVNAKGIVCSAISLQWVKRISFENLYFSKSIALRTT